jgi:hypothetical protein
LLARGLITVERVGNQKHDRANRASPVFAELNGLIVRSSTIAGSSASLSRPSSR